MLYIYSQPFTVLSAPLPAPLSDQLSQIYDQTPFPRDQLAPSPSPLLKLKNVPYTVPAFWVKGGGASLHIRKPGWGVGGGVI